MDLNLKIKLESPELMAAILALAEALPQIGSERLSAIKDGQVLGSSVIEISSKQSDEKKEEVKTVTIDEVRAVLGELSKAGREGEMRALINKFGGSKLGKVPVENYSELLREAEKCLGKG